MIQIDEYALAAVLLPIGMFAFSVQIYDWKGIDNHRKATQILKGVASLLIVGSLVFFGAVIIKKKGTKLWSNLLPERIAPVTPEPSIDPSPRRYAVPAPGTANLVCRVVVAESLGGFGVELPGATVTAQNNRTHKSYSGTTGPDGTVTLNVPREKSPGQFYTIKATHQNYRSGAGANYQIYVDEPVIDYIKLILEPLDNATKNH
jgi:hypothetical protein